ncbi:G protein pathway suppressor 2 isoform X2 [Carcharodon carcharias]|uniref:G protein pathway suppressor 2 isoform X2 n=1 Tax=Carcharodon carcharias TaxID=13397 RepID=UPI001B7F124E|nr:G protein pathway suppressor 2 isoform X2 [Carcharodon carcharias]
MPALLERPKMSSAMARALHQHIMKERARKRQEEEEVDKMMEQKMKEEQERKRKKEMEERMSLEETKEQISKMELKLQSLQEEKHQLFLQLKKVLHEEEKRRAKMKEQRYKRLFCLKASGPTVITLAKRFFGCKVLWNILRVVKHCRHKQPPSRTLRYHRQASDMNTLTQATYPQALAVHSSQHLINIQEGHGRPGGLLGDRPKSQMFPSGAIAQSRAFTVQAGFTAAQTDHPQYQTGQSGHSSYPVSQTQHGPPYGPGQTVTYASSQQLRGPSAFQAMSAYIPHQQTAYAVHGHFTPQQGFIPPSTAIPLQKQLEHANQQSGFTDSAALAYVHPQRPASPGGFPHGTPPQQALPTGFQTTSQAAPRHAYLQHSQGQRYYHQ